MRETGLFLTGIFPLLFVPAAAGVMELGSQLMNLFTARRAGDCADHGTGHGGHGHGRAKCAGGKEHKMAEFLQQCGSWGVLATLAAYAAGVWVNRKTGKALFNPL